MGFYHRSIEFPRDPGGRTVSPAILFTNTGGGGGVLQLLQPLAEPAVLRQPKMDATESWSINHTTQSSQEKGGERGREPRLRGSQSRHLYRKRQRPLSSVKATAKRWSWQSSPSKAERARRFLKNPFQTLLTQTRERTVLNG